MHIPKTDYRLVDFYNVVVPRFVAACHKFRSKIDTEIVKIKKDKTYNLDNPKNIYKKEADYHTKINKKNETNLSVFPLHNMLSSGYKLLMNRTLNQIYDGVINDLMEEDEGINPIIQYTIDYLYTQQLGQLLYNMVLSHPDVCKFMESIVLELEQQANVSIKHLDQQPVIEQKTEPWFAARKNTISASVCGYIDARACGCDMSKETNQIKEKTELIEKKQFGWYQMPLRRGQQFEDMTRAYYESIHQISAKEYGLIIDEEHSHIAASPDGIVVNVPDGANYLRRRLLGRMIEIKNPYSAAITQASESYYYWQTQQQMKVCKLPACDFVKTRFRLRGNYIETAPRTDLPWDEFNNDTFDLCDFQDNCKTWSDISNYLSPVIYNNLRWHILGELIDPSYSGHINLGNLPEYAMQMFANNFNSVSPCLVENLTGKEPSGYFDARGRNPAMKNTYRAMPKGFLWCWNIFDPETGLATADFKVEFTLPYVAVSQDMVSNQFQEWNTKYEKMGYRLFECYMWNLCEYQNIEVEYNQGLYEGWDSLTGGENCVLNRLHNKWSIIQELMSISDNTERWRAYAKYYPGDKSIPAYVFEDNEPDINQDINANDWDLD